MKTQITLGILITMVVLSFVVFKLFSLRHIPKKRALPRPSVVISSPVASASATTQASNSATLAKNQLTMQILNGSEISGLAGKLKDTFSDLGYKDIEIGNASKDQDTTTVSFDSRVSKQVRQEVQKELQRSFSTVETSEASGEAKFNISITTGKQS